ncbi:hypothetical protein, partial [Acinetobacter baumannii]|uniref:hypothetical protein n=1 Tax=Acinetobacter baumannii TaxID=470 RepID=UPI001BB4622B
NGNAYPFAHIWRQRIIAAKYSFKAVSSAADCSHQNPFPSILSVSVLLPALPPKPKAPTSLTFPAEVPINRDAGLVVRISVICKKAGARLEIPQAKVSTNGRFP